MLEKATTIKSFEYSPLGNELKKQTDVVEKKYQRVNKFFTSNKREKPVRIKEQSALTDGSKLMYDSKCSFSDH